MSLKIRKFIPIGVLRLLYFSLMRIVTYNIALFHYYNQ